ncbi:MAG: hypothetical protein MHPSP_004176, partial [Paramarteilia canceri]
KLLPICPYKIMGSEECKCGSKNGGTITIDSSGKYCYSSECTKKIHDCTKNGGKVKYDSDEDCPSCETKPLRCDDGSKIDGCNCDEDRPRAKISGEILCFSSDCAGTIKNCKNNNGEFSPILNNDCPTCLKKCEPGLISNSCTCDNDRKKEIIGDNAYCEKSTCSEITNECKDNRIFDEDSQCVTCSNVIDEPKIIRRQNIVIIVAVVVAILLLIAAIIILAIYNNHHSDIVELAQIEDHQNKLEISVNNDHYNIVPIRAESE